MTKFDRDFNQYYHDKYILDIKVFYSYPIEMQFGVYQLFADSVGVELRIRINHLTGMYLGIINQGITDAKRTRTEVMDLLIIDFKKQYIQQ